MKLQSYLARSRRRGHVGWIVLALLLTFNLAAYSGGQSAKAEKRVIRSKPQIEAVPLSTGLAFSLLVGAGLIVAGRSRRRRDRLDRPAPVADFELAFRLQHAPRKRIDATPLFRDGTMRLRRNLSALGCDH